MSLLLTLLVIVLCLCPGSCHCPGIPGIPAIPGTYHSAIQFSSPTYYTEELYGNLTIPVIKTGDNQTSSVSYTTVDGSALAGTDYIATSGTLNFLPGDTQKDIVIPLTMDGWYTEGKHLQVILSKPVNTYINRSIADIYINASRTVLYYNFTKDTGTTVVDDSGLGNNGKAYGSCANVYSDASGSYIWFNNSRTGGKWDYYDYVATPSVPSLNATSITMEAVIRTNKTDASFGISPTFNTILIKRIYGQNGYWFGTQGNGHPYAYFTNNGNITNIYSYSDIYNPATVADNRTHFLAVSYNTTQWTWVVDGVVTNSGTGHFQPIGQTALQLELSQVANNHAIQGNEYMVKVMNGAETAEQMLTDYQTQAWRLTGNTSTVPTDKSTAILSTRLNVILSQKGGETQTQGVSRDNNVMLYLSVVMGLIAAIFTIAWFVAISTRKKK
jgi:hypothetical protein